MKQIAFLLIVILSTTFFSAADTWTQKADFGGIGRENAVGFAIEGKGYIGTGGSIISAGKSFWEYDPSTNVWTQKADFAGEGREFASGFSIGDKGYLGLGKVSDNLSSNEWWEYDPVANDWLQKASFPGGPRWNAFEFSLGGKGYVGAGSGKSAYKQDFYEYNPMLDVWTQKATYPGGKVIAATTFAIADKGYVGTGRNDFGSFKNDIWQYDPATDTWIQKSDFVGGIRDGSVGFSIAGFGYVGLGRTLDTNFFDFWQYIPEADNWIQKADYPGGGAGDRVGFAIGSFGYVGTGGAAENEFFQYTPDCMKPIVLYTTNIKSTSARANWNLVSNSQTYTVRYRQVGTQQWSKTTALFNFKKLIGLFPDTEYDWSVKSVCDAVNNISSDWSAIQNFTTKPLRLEEGEIMLKINLEIYPNPFWTSTTISFFVAENSRITIELFDLTGRKIKTLFNNYPGAGSYKTVLHREQLKSGIYLLRITMNAESSITKIFLQ